ncbi:MAG TPA: RNA methyltransferase [Natronincola sp.]|nr:RNA methyltransferase [Natronincola sp.]
MSHVPVIESKTNELIKSTKRLQQKKFRDQLGLFFLEGIRIVEESLETPLVQRIFFTKVLHDDPRGKALLLKAKRQGIEIFECGEPVFRVLADTVNSQGVIAVVKKPTWSTIPRGVLLIADEIQDPGNMGTMLRTATGAGADGLIIAPGSVDPYNPKVVRSSMGAILHLPHWSLNHDEIFGLLEKESFKIVVADLVDAVEYSTISYPSNLAVVIGNEARGVSPIFLEKSDLKVYIPLLGPVESLNASVAAGILLYEILRQRRCNN